MTTTVIGCCDVAYMSTKFTRSKQVIFPPSPSHKNPAFCNNVTREINGKHVSRIRHRAITSMYSLTFHVRRYAVMCTYCQYARHYVVTATKPANSPNSAQLGGTHYYSPKLYIRVRAVVWACGRGQTHIARVTTIHFVSATTHAKCNDDRTCRTSYN